MSALLISNSAVACFLAANQFLNLQQVWRLVRTGDPDFTTLIIQFDFPDQTDRNQFEQSRASKSGSRFERAEIGKKRFPFGQLVKNSWFQLVSYFLFRKSKC